jgi:ankyrin repeat protein
MRAVAERHPDVVRALVDARADVTARSRGGFTALLFASQQGDLESARILLSAGAAVDEATPEHGTALVLAVASGRENVALFLLEKGANPNAVDAYGLSALHYALPKGLAAIDSVSVVFRPHEEVPPNMPGLVKALLARGANPNLQVTKDFPPYSRSPYALQTSLVGVTPFLMASAAGDVELMRVLLDGGADPHLRLKDGSTAVMLAAGIGRVDDRPAKDEANALEAVKLAFEVAGDLDATNARGRGALHGAAGIGANAIIQFLAEKGANLELKDRQGSTALKIAAGGAPRGDGANRVYQTTMDLLVKLGADPAAINAPEIPDGRRVTRSISGNEDQQQ